MASISRISAAICVAAFSTLIHVATAAVEINVMSMGFTDLGSNGMMPSEFHVGDELLGVAIGRGINVAVLHANGTLRESNTFDTHEAGGSDALVAYLDALAFGTPALFAVQDDAAASLNEAAKLALEGFGAREIRSLEYQGSYALVGFKGLPSVAENVTAAGVGPTNLTARFEPITPLAGVSVSVTSAPSGTSFTALGTSLGVPSITSGASIAVLEADGSLRESHNYDLPSDTDALVTLLEGLEHRTTILVAAQASTPVELSDAAKAALASFGANLVGDASWPSSYALVGAKGGPALSEKLATEGAVEVTLTSLVVKSAGYVDGNVAQFYVNGADLSVTTGRGLNAVVLNADGSVSASHTFDTFGPYGSEELVSVMSGLEDGTVVLLAAQDEPRRNLTFAAKEAVKSLGSTLIDDISFRASYALIGVKGGEALAEGVTATRYGGVVLADHAGKVLPLVTTTITSTTTSRVDCSYHQCSEGQILKTTAWTVVGNDDATCCVEAYNLETSLMVRSRGWDDDATPRGGVARFYVGDLELGNSFCRTGLNVITLRPDASVNETRNFNTNHGPGADDLAEFLNGLQDGQLVMIAALDEAWESLHNNDAAKDAIRRLGAAKIDDLRRRGAYALIGAKGATAPLAERVLSEGDGVATAIAHITVVRSSEQLPLCPKDTREPVVAGYLSNGNLRLDDGCRYEIWPRANAGECLKGTWAVVAGGSNTVLMSMGLANLLSPETIHPILDHASMGSTTIVDVIIEDGNVTYKNSSRLPGCTNLGYDAACQELMRRHIAQAPAFSPNATRVTQFIAQYWDHVAPAIDIVQNDANWQESKVAFLTQVSAWYIYCSIKQVEWCPRGELREEPDADGVRAFTEQMTPIMTQLDAFCGEDRVRTCMVGTTSWQAPNEEQEFWYEQYNEAITEATLGTTNLKLLDFWKLGISMPDECIGGHGSPVANLWIWNIVLHGICNSTQAAEGSVAEFQGDLCFGAGLPRQLALIDKCPFYTENCENTFRCEVWECANSMPCTMVLELPPLPGTCLKAVQANFTNFTTELSGEQTEQTCPHVWCDEDLNPWIMPAAAVGAAAMLMLGMEMKGRFLPKRLQPRDAKKVTEAPTPKKDDKAKADDAHSVAETNLNDVPVEVPPSPVSSAPISPRTPAPDPVVLPIEAIGSEGNYNNKEDVIGLAESPKTPLRLAVHIPVDEPEVQPMAKEPQAKAEEVAKPAKPAAGPAKAGDKFPLGAARFLASMHVVVGHLYARNVTAPIYFFGWGFTWVPWFFMLSGFVLFSAHLRRPKSEGVIEYVLRRSVTIYPLYAVSLIPSFAIAKSHGRAIAEPSSIPVLISQSFLTQAWWPWFTEQALQAHCWFLSCMVVYWLCFKPLAWCLKDLSLRKTVSLMTALFALPWLTILIPAAMDESIAWYKQHSWGATDTWLDIVVVMLKFSPICYAHVFVLGMLLAKLRLLLDAHATAAGAPLRWRLPMEFVMPIGYAGLALIFCSPHMAGGFDWNTSWGYKISARVSVLLPFQAAVLLGLAGLPSLPLPRLAFVMSKLNFLENYSYAMYVFQFLLHEVWPQAGDISLIPFLIFTVAGVVILVHTVQRPVQKWWGDHPKARVGVPFVLAALLTSLTFIPDSHSATGLPAMVRLDNQTIDIRLPLTDRANDGAALINPALLVHGDSLVVTARRHSLHLERSNGEYQGNDSTVISQIWRSDVLLGTTEFDAQAWASWPTTGVAPFSAELRAWSGLETPGPEGKRWGHFGEHLCVAETWVPENNTLLRRVVTGPEEAKAVLVNGSVSVAFDSLPPLGEDGCPEGQEVSQMYLASSVSPGSPSEVAQGYHLNYGSDSRAEKNWIPFTYENRLHFVYQPVPHMVLTCEADGACMEVGNPQVFRPLQQLMREGKEVRGSGQAVLIDDPEATPNLPQRHYLALIHVVQKSRPKDGYVHFAYRFSAEPPFQVLQVSEQLQLQLAPSGDRSNPFAFVSGLAVHNRTVAISYGAGDREARALVMTLGRLDEMFACDVDVAPEVATHSHEQPEEP